MTGRIFSFVKFVVIPINFFECHDCPLKGEPEWQGMIADILSGDADLISASLTITPPRATAVDFLPAMGLEKYSLVLEIDSIEDVSWRTFGMQFRANLWIVVTACSIMFSIIISLIGITLGQEVAKNPEVQ
jgi:hypothetical protein